MTNQNDDGRTSSSDSLGTGPEQGGSNLGGLGSTSATDRDRDPEAEGLTKPEIKTRAREQAIVDQAEGDTNRQTTDGGN